VTGLKTTKHAKGFLFGRHSPVFRRGEGGEIMSFEPEKDRKSKINGSEKDGDLSWKTGKTRFFSKNLPF